MKMFIRILTCGLVASALTLGACGDDDKDTTPTPDTSTGTDTNPGTDTSTDTDTNTDEPIEAGEACNNASDLAIITSGDKNPIAKATACGTSGTCIPLALSNKMDEFEDCAMECMLDANNATYPFVVSEDCSACYVKSIGCTAQNCLQECVSDANSPGCLACRDEKGCTDAFYTCAGLPRQ